MTPYTDTHFHLQSMAEKGIDLSTLGIESGMDIGCEPEDLTERLPLISLFPGICYSAAAGPWSARRSESPEELVRILKSNAEKYHPHLIGEIGLDWYRAYGTKEKQIELFIRQIDLANELSLPIAIHTRDADEDTIRLIKEHPVKRGGVMHCFSGGDELADTALECGYHLSFAGNMTYKSNGHLRSVLGRTPKSRLLLETDSPYLAPVPYRGKLNTPMLISATYAVAAEIRGIEVEELKELVKQNFEALVRLDESVRDGESPAL